MTETKACPHDTNESQLVQLGAVTS